MKDYIVYIYNRGTKEEIRNKVFSGYASIADVKRAVRYNPNKEDIEIFEIEIKQPPAFSFVR
jgi:hypothetical protein